MTQPRRENVVAIVILVVHLTYMNAESGAVNGCENFPPPQLFSTEFQIHPVIFATFHSLFRGLVLAIC